MSIYPSEELGEYFCWFGSTTIRKGGTPICFYTSIGKTCGPIAGTTQWAATGSPDLINWEKIPGNPVMPREINKDNILRWCDPHVFICEGRTYCLIGGKLDDPDNGTPVICLYRAENDELTEWSYKGILFRHPNQKLRSMECPNIFQLDGKWVIALSPHGPLEFWIGDLDPEACTFKISGRAFADRGCHLYASNYMRDDTGRILLFGSIEGFTENSGWRGCLNLPRVVAPDGKGGIALSSAEELKALRGEHRTIEAQSLASGVVIPELANESECELCIDAEDFQLELKGDSGTVLTVTAKDGEIRIPEKQIVFPQPDGEQHHLHIFLDRTVIEIFFDQKECFTGVIPSASAPRSLVLSGRGTLCASDVYRLNADDIYSYSYGTFQNGVFQR